MSNTSSKYKEDILRLKSEGKKYLEISKILGCSKSLAQYYMSDKQQKTAAVTRRVTQKSVNVNRKKGVIRNRKYVDDILKNSSCIDCGNNDPRVLEFDHVRGNKMGHVSHGIKNAWNLTKLQDEIDKCEIRCCNCHRIATIERRKHKLS
jgi:DNA-binding CsgD family transcriptional regulator